MINKTTAVPVNMSDFSKLEISTLATFFGLCVQQYPEETDNIINTLYDSDVPYDIGIFLKILEMLRECRDRRDAEVPPMNSSGIR